MMKIKNTFTKILSSFLVMTMVFSLCVSIHTGDSLNVKALSENGEYSTSTIDDETVAIIGERKFSTLNDAVSDLKSGETIKLVKDVVLNDCLRFDSDNVTLDLNGHTISQSEDFNVSESFFIRNQKTLTICDTSSNSNGKITSNKITIYATGSLNLKSGTIENTGNNHALYMNGAASLNISGGKIIGNNNGIRTQNGYTGSINIDGGEISANIAIYADDGDIKINDGKIIGTAFGLYIQSVTLNITGGTIEANVNDGIRVFRDTQVDIINGNISGNRSSIYATYTDSDEDNSITINIKGGNYSNKSSINPIVSGGPADADIATNTNKIKLLISGGKFSNKPNYDYLAPGYRLDGDNNNGWDVISYAAEVVDAAEGSQRYYQTLQNAIGNGSNIKLLGDRTECITISENKNITLDLNGHTLTGVKDENGKMGNVLTNNGILIITDSSESKMGTIMGGTDTGEGTAGRGGIALVNNATCTIENGNIKRGDDNTFGNYTIQNNGDLTVNGGTISNNSNVSSLLVNSERVNKNATLTINGGTISQPAGIAVKNESGLTKITGGKIYSDTSYALQCWTDTEVTDGIIEGSVVVFTYNGSTAELNITGGTIGRGDGDYIRAWNYYDNGPAENAPVLKISKDAVVKGELQAIESKSNGENYICKDDKVASIKVSGGTFDRVVPDYACANGFVSQIADDGNYTMKSAVSIKYIGGSLLTKDTFEKVNMRFSYTFALPEGCTIDNVELYWKWGTSEDNLNRTVTATKWSENGDGTYTANLVINNVPVINGGYERSIYAQFVATCEDTVSIDVKQNIGDVNKQSAKTVAHSMLLSNSITEEQKTYIEQLISIYENQNSDETE